MLEYSAVEGSWAKVTPPADLIAASPWAPSEAAPERTTPIARSPASAASERRKASIGR